MCNKTKEKPYFRLTVFLMVAATVVLSLYVQWQSRRHFIPGNWHGESGMFPPHVVWVLPLIILTVITVGYLTISKKYWYAVAVCVIVVGPTFVRWPIGDWEYRYDAEKASYHKAVSEGSKYGAQYSEEVDGRTLTYWCWWRSAIDNGIGILYDPEDRLDKESRDDFLSFKSVTGGIIVTVVPIEPGWYYVKHT